VRCFLCGTDWIIKYYLDELRFERINWFIRAGGVDPCTEVAEVCTCTTFSTWSFCESFPASDCSHLCFTLPNISFVIGIEVNFLPEWNDSYNQKASSRSVSIFDIGERRGRIQIAMATWKMSWDCFWTSGPLSICCSSKHSLRLEPLRDRSVCTNKRNGDQCFLRWDWEVM
jgi:hypothetical protein